VAGRAVAEEMCRGFPITMKFFLNLICIWSDSRYILVSNLLTYYLKISWDLKALIPTNFVLFYLNEGQNLLSDGQISKHGTEHKIIWRGK
jgi:hypothetical protein